MSTAQPLDDKDEFFTPIPYFWGPAGMGKTDWEAVRRFELESSRKVLRERAPNLMAHQKAFLASVGLGEVSEVGGATVQVRKGPSKPRETPLLCNTPRTTPETAKYLPDRQHSTDVILHSEPLNDKDEWEPSFPLLTDKLNVRFDASWVRQRLQEGFVFKPA